MACAVLAEVANTSARHATSSVDAMMAACFIFLYLMIRQTLSSMAFLLNPLYRGSNTRFPSSIPISVMAYPALASSPKRRSTPSSQASSISRFMSLHMTQTSGLNQWRHSAATMASFSAAS